MSHDGGRTLTPMSMWMGVHGGRRECGYRKLADNFVRLESPKCAENYLSATDARRSVEASPSVSLPSSLVAVTLHFLDECWNKLSKHVNSCIHTWSGNFKQLIVMFNSENSQHHLTWLHTYNYVPDCGMGKAELQLNYYYKKWYGHGQTGWSASAAYEMNNSTVLVELDYPCSRANVLKCLFHGWVFKFSHYASWSSTMQSFYSILDRSEAARIASISLTCN